MAEEQLGQEKTEEPTPRKEEKAREDGQVARSRELNGMAMLVTGSVGLIAFGEVYAKTLVHIMRETAEMAATQHDEMLAALEFAATEALWMTVPLLALILVAGVASSLGIGGLVFSTKAMAFKGNRLSPLAGFKRMFSMRSLVELGKAIAKVAVVVGVALAVLNAMARDMLALALAPLEPAVIDSLGIVAWSLAALSASLVIIAAVDVPFQIAEFRKQLKMTKQEVRDEMKDSEGRPEVKSRIRRLQQELARRRMLADVPNADVVITNPEHYSVALRYDPEAMSAPVVLAKGADLIALKIREIASAHDVPVLESPPLTRAIYHATEVGGEVPAPLYVAIAQVLAYVYQLQRFRNGTGSAPRLLPDIEIPETYRRDE
ncbi:MAG: flagellar biosynthesis protein FlhB [Gammaproteobacteria bacterium]|nr:flagellar biosynthesis protein FlhB [Gammaproteobacteria bacterium]